MQSESIGPIQKRNDAFSIYMSKAEIADILAKALSSNNEIIGRLSINQPDDVERVYVLIPPEWWTDKIHERPDLIGIGSYLLTIDPKTLIASLLIVVNARTEPIIGNVQQSYVNLESPRPASGYAVVPLKVEARIASSKHLALLIDNSSIESVVKNTSRLVSDIARLPRKASGVMPDPNSPVVVPHPDVLVGFLFREIEEGENYVLGALGTLDTEYITGDGKLVPFLLPWSVARKHVLITGTTGSGKTSLIKNLIAGISYSHESRRIHGTASILVLDASGDYRVSVFPGVPRSRKRILKLYSPCWKIENSLKSLIIIPYKGNNRVMDTIVKYVRELWEESKILAGRPVCNPPVLKPMVLNGCTFARVVSVCMINGVRANVDFAVVPIGIKIKDIDKFEIILKIDPYMTARAKEILNSIIIDKNVKQACSNLPAEKILDYMINAMDYYLKKTTHSQSLKQKKNLCLDEILRLIENYGPRPETIKSMKLRLNLFKQLGIIVNASKKVCDADFDSLIKLYNKIYPNRKSRIIIADLDYAASIVGGPSGDQIKVTLGYKLLTSLMRYKESISVEDKTFLVIDEAHLFFPSEIGTNEEEKQRHRILTSAIKRITRLGRSRGVSVIFSTHRPSDVDRIIITLSNTKIYMRTDRKTARDLELPEELRVRLPFFSDHAGVVESYYILGGFATFVGGPSILGHKLA